MLETERYDRESDNDNNEAAGHAAGVTPEPAEAGDAAERPDPGSKDAGGPGRRRFRRGRRAATRPAGPPVDDPVSGSDQAHGGAPAVPAPSVPAPAEQASRDPAGSAPGVPAPAMPPQAEQAARAPASPEPSVPPQGVSAPASPPPAVTFTGTSAPAAAQAPEASQAPAPAFQPPLVIFQPPDISSGGAHRPAPGEASSPEADAPEEGRPSGAVLVLLAGAGRRRGRPGQVGHGWCRGGRLLPGQ